MAESSERAMGEPIMTNLCPSRVSREECFLGEYCTGVHAEVCDLCDTRCLHPDDAEQRARHRMDCVRMHERNMEFAFLVQRSQEQMCGICQEIVMSKAPPSDSRFGILDQCAHVFCLRCIRTWRSTRGVDRETVLSCPICRITSELVIPSELWVGAGPVKDNLVASYTKAMHMTPCRYFQQRNGRCPFGRRCHYRHDYTALRESRIPFADLTERRRVNQPISILRSYIFYETVVYLGFHAGSIFTFL